MNRISCKLSDLVEVKNGSTPSTTRSDFYDGNIVWITPKDLSNNKIKFIYSSERKITKAGFDSCSTSLLPIGSVLLSSRAPIGLLAICAVETCTNQGFKNLVVKKDKLHNEYLYYWLKTKVKYINSLGTGTTFKEVSKGVIESLLIELPKELKDQQKIASVLSALDSKIELNNRINAELEAMAKTLYDYWFVQFDFPNAKGKPYKTSGGKMVWNEELKREVPQGWEVEGIEKSCLIIDCLHSKKSELIFEDESSFLLQLENIKDDGLIDLTSKYYVRKEEYQRWTSRIEVKENDILITNAGRVAATAQMPKDIVSGIGRNITAIRPTKISPTYLFLSFRGADLKRQIRLNTDSGAFFTSFNVKGIKKLQFLRPKNKIEEKFEELVRPVRQKRELNNIENQKLTELRDWLLPMLMNGQVKVKEAEERLSMATEPGVKYGK